MAVLKDLIVHGASRFLNGSYFNTINAESIGASEGVFNKIVATTGRIDSLSTEDLTANNATVLSLLDVRGELHTNQWTNSNIATIDGSFYITPTIGIPEGTMTTTANSVTVNGSNFPISSLYVNGINSDNTASTVAWTSGSKVLVTGEILVNGTYMPLGTLIGILDGDASPTQIKIKSITDNRYKTAESLAEIGTQSTALPCRNVKVSLYQTSRSSTLYPLGIFMTALGENGKTFLDIYGGGYAVSTAVAGGFAKPVLRIGNLAGLPAVGGKTPVGYGIYTSNGYFSGTIVSTNGQIGNFTINSALYSNGHSTWDSSGNGIYINNDGISGGPGGKWWLWQDGSARIGAMTLTAAGVLSVPAASITGTLTAGQIAANSINASKLSIGDWTNLATANEFQESSLPVNVSEDFKVIIDSGYLVKKTATNNYLMFTEYTLNSFKTGDELYFEFYGKAATAGNISVNVYAYDANRGYKASNGFTISLTTTETKYFGTIVLSNTYWDTAAYYLLAITDNKSTKSQIYVRKVIFRRKSAGELIVDGSINANKISVSTLSAISANMGTLTAGTISYGTVGNNESFYLSNTNKTATIAGASRNNLRLAIGSGFGVDKDGKLYATGAIISGALTATSLTINSGATIGGDGASQILNSEIEVGGRNLARGTATMIKGNGNWNTGTWRDSGASNTYNYTVSDSPVPSVNKGVLVTTATANTRYGVAQDGCPMLNKQITFSVWAKGTSGGTITLQSVWWNGISVSNWSKPFTANGNWQYFSFTTNLTNVTIPNNACSICYMYWTGVNANDSCIFIAPKLEYGNIATSWSPAPEDIDVNKYITTISGTSGISVHNIDDENNFVNINSSGMSVYKGGKADANKVAFFGSDVQIGATNSGYIKIAPTGTEIYGGNGTKRIAHIGYNTLVRDQFASDGSTNTFTLSATPIADGTTIPSTVKVTRNGTTLTVTSGLPNANTVFYYEYFTNTVAPNYIFGQMLQNNDTTSEGYIPGSYSFGSGYDIIASGYCSSATGYSSIASGDLSHAEGNSTAEGYGSHAEGHSDIYGDSYYAHAEGQSTASNYYAHSEGVNTIASGWASHSQNENTIASKSSQTAIGTYNKEDESTSSTHPNGDSSYGKYAFIIGNGTSKTNRSNALTVDWNGDMYFKNSTLPLGYIKSHSINSSSYNLTTATWTVVGDAFTLEAGTWIITFGANFASHSTGVRYLVLNNSSTASASAGRYDIVVSAASNASVGPQATRIVSLTGTTNYYLHVYQNSGASLTVYPHLEAIKIL